MSRSSSPSPGIVRDEPERSARSAAAPGARFFVSIPELATVGSSDAKRLRNASSSNGLASAAYSDSAPPEGLVDVNVLLEGESRVEHDLHSLHAIGLDRLLYLARMIRGMLDDALAHLFLAAPE